MLQRVDKGDKVVFGPRGQAQYQIIKLPKLKINRSKAVGIYKDSMWVAEDAFSPEVDQQIADSLLQEDLRNPNEPDNTKGNPLNIEVYCPSAAELPSLTDIPTKHSDPFDRAFVGLAQLKGWTAVTSDEPLMEAAADVVTFVDSKRKWENKRQYSAIILT